MILLLWACAHVDPIPHVAAPAPPPVVEEEEAPPPLAPPGWRTGQHAATAVRQSPTEAWSRVLEGPITEPITTDGERVYAVAEGRIYCFSLDGSPLWGLRSDATTAVVPMAVGMGVDATVMVGTASGKVLVLNPKDGSTLQTLAGVDTVVGAPVQLPEEIAWGTARGDIVRRPLGASPIVAGAGGGIDHRLAGPLAADGDTVYAVGYFETLLPNGPMGDDGKPTLTPTRAALLVASKGSDRLWSAVLPANGIEGATLDAEREYVGFEARPGKPGGVIAFDRQGKEVWRHTTRFQPSAPLGIGGDPSRPLLLVPDRDGHVYALDPATGDEVWAMEGFGDFGIQPTTVEGQIYVGNADGHVSRVDGDGGVVWSVLLGAPVTAEPAFAGGKMFVGLGNGRIVALAEGG